MIFMNKRSKKIENICVVQNIWRWISNDSSLYKDLSVEDNLQIDAFRLAVFVSMHIACLSVFYVVF